MGTHPNTNAVKYCLFSDSMGQMYQTFNIVLCDIFICTLPQTIHRIFALYYIRLNPIVIAGLSEIHRVQIILWSPDLML